jgi:hypothetical protein
MAKVEHGVNGAKEVAAVTTVAGEWETLNFDFSEAGADYDNVVLFINGGTESGEADSILVDDITLVDFAQSPNATISGLQYDGNDVPGTHQTILSYRVELPAGSSAVPTVTATTSHANATALVTPAAQLPGTSTVQVTAEDGVASITYSIEFTLEVRPTMAAPSPPQRDPSKVISIFSDAYANMDGIDYNPNWGQSTVVSFDTIAEGDTMMIYGNLNYQGIAFAGETDASAMEFLHVDMWTHDATAITVTPISPGGETGYALPITLDTWVSYDIPLSEFSDVVDFSKTHQMKFDAESGQSGVKIFLDNIYYYRNLSTDATLSDIQVDGSSIPGFESGTNSYDVELAAGTVNVPVITATPTDANATVVIVDAEALPGTTTITVTSEDGSAELIYSVNMTVKSSASSDATLSDLQVDGTTIADFDAATLVYTMELEYGTVTVPTVSAVANDIAATVVITDAAALPGTTEIVVTAEDASTVNTYSVEFTVAAPLGFPLDFESGPYTFNDFDGGAVTIMENPDMSGINTSANVAKMVKSAGQTWGGSWIALDEPIDFSVSKMLKMKVHAPKVGSKVLLKVENMSDGGIAYEVEMATTVANQWEELSFDYSAIDDTKEYQKVVLIFELGTMGDGSANFTYYFDDVTQEGISSDIERINNPGIEVNVFAFNDILRIHSDETVIHGSYRVYDLTGRMVHQSSITSTREEYRLNKKGLYIVHITDAKGQHVTAKKVMSR